ncbi:nitroreductase family protein [Dyadobacter sp. UC 10]|nr:nitroreductase family protein [Dyadobacter sp. UC 10]
MINKIKGKYNYLSKVFIRDTLPRFCYKSNFLSSLYYFLFDPSFAREHRATLTGKVKHIEEARKTKANYFLLVRNTHRIEKGLLMRPKRAVFGKDYLSETIDSFEGVWNEKEIVHNPQMKWFYDVLSEYFSGDPSDPFIASHHQRFLAKTQSQVHKNGFASDCSTKSVPYYRLDSERSSINFDEFYKLTKQRRSVRWFTDKPVARELIDKAILAANQSPSACNRQPFEFRIFDDPDLVEKVVKFPMGTKGYGHSIPVMIVLIGNLDAYFDERDRHVIYIDASLAAMSLMLALETMGLSSCAINWPDIEAREKMMEDFLKINKHQRPIMCLGLGYADQEGMVAFSEKRPLSQIRRYN